jgi:hypothetical protein
MMGGGSYVLQKGGGWSNDAIVGELQEATISEERGKG